MEMDKVYLIACQKWCEQLFELHNNYGKISNIFGLYKNLTMITTLFLCVINVI